jgi:hypothetical protein
VRASEGEGSLPSVVAVVDNMTSVSVIPAHASGIKKIAPIPFWLRLSGFIAIIPQAPIVSHTYMISIFR